MGNIRKKITAASIIFLLLSILGCTGFEENTQMLDYLNSKTPGAKFEKKSELYKTLQKNTTAKVVEGEEPPCVEMIYPLNLKKYDSENRLIGSANVMSDVEFSKLLSTLPEQESLSISYPITTTLADNTTYTVNNNAELNIALNNCTREDIIRYYDGILVPPSSIKSIFWKVKYTENGDNTYYSGIFQITTGGYLTFYYNNKIYNGTWFFIFINDQLNINIHLDNEDNSDVAAYWNINRPMETNGPVFTIKNLPKDIVLEQIIESRTIYKVGDKGPSNGIVFYDKGEYTFGWRYMELASQDLKSSEWGCANTPILNARNTELGSGYFNTAQILKYHDNLTNYYQNPAVCNTANNGSVLAKYAVEYTQTINADWFLPSLDELDLIYHNVYLKNLGNLTTANYWSSTEVNETTVSTILFETGEKALTLKIPAKNTVKARAIRYF